MTNMRVAIVDDEEPARNIVREYLSAWEDVDIVAECANGFEAVKAVSEVKPTCCCSIFRCRVSMASKSSSLSGMR